MELNRGTKQSSMPVAPVAPISLYIGISSTFYACFRPLSISNIDPPKKSKHSKSSARKMVRCVLSFSDFLGLFLPLTRAKPQDRTGTTESG